MSSKLHVLPLPEQFRAARALLNMPCLHVADSAGISETAVWNCEKGKTDRTDTLLKVMHAYELLGIEFIDPTTRKGAGVRIKSPKRHRKPKLTSCETIRERQDKLRPQLEKLGIL